FLPGVGARWARADYSHGRGATAPRSHMVSAPQCPDVEAFTEPGGCASIQWKYLMYCLISASLRLWFGIGRLLNSFSMAFASASVSSIFSGALSQRVSQASLRRLVTPARSGPSFLPSPTEWQARHLLSKSSLPRAASGSVGAAVASMLWCSRSGDGGLASVELSPRAPFEAVAKWGSPLMLETGSRTASYQALLRTL